MKKKVLLIAVVTLFAFTAKAQIVVTSTQASSYTEPAPKWERPTGLFMRGDIGLDCPLDGSIYGTLKFGMGYQFNSKFALDAGVSYRKYDQMSFIPLYVGTRIHMTNGSVQPFFNLKMGIPLFSTEAYYREYIYMKANGLLFSFDFGLSMKYFNISAFVSRYNVALLDYSRATERMGQVSGVEEVGKEGMIDIGLKIGFDLYMKKQ